MTGSKNGMVFHLYKHIYELGCQNDLIQYHWIIHHQNAVGRPVGFQQIMTDIVSAVNFIRGYIQKFPDWPPGATTASGTALCH
jgi:hypothetical protein